MFIANKPYRISSRLRRVQKYIYTSYLVVRLNAYISTAYYTVTSLSSRGRDVSRRILARFPRIRSLPHAQRFPIITPLLRESLQGRLAINPHRKSNSEMNHLPTARIVPPTCILIITKRVLTP